MLSVKNARYEYITARSNIDGIQGKGELCHV